MHTCTTSNRVTVSLINAKSCNILLRILLACIRSYLKSLLRNKFLILDNHRPETLNLYIYVSKDVGICGYLLSQMQTASKRVQHTLGQGIFSRVKLSQRVTGNSLLPSTQLMLGVNMYLFPQTCSYGEQGQLYRYRSIRLGLCVGKVYIYVKVKQSLLQVYGAQSVLFG